MRMQTMRTCVSTARASKHIRRVRVQKGGCKFGKQPVYRRKSWWKDYKNPCCCGCVGKSRPLSAYRRKHLDASVAVDLLSGVNISGSNILGDKAYGAKSIRAYIAEQGASYTIPPKSNVVEPWFCDFHTYKERHLIECFFNKLKVFRRVATRYDKLAVSFLAFVHLASIWILLK